MLDAPFYVVHLEGLAALFVENELHCLIPRDMAKAKER